MRAVVMTLLLFITIGTRGAVLWKDEPQTDLDEVRNSLHIYLHQVSDTARGAIEQIDNSKIGKQLNLRISKSLDNLGVYVAELQKIVTPLSDEIHQRFQKDSAKLEEKFREGLKEFKAKILLYTEDLHNKVNKNVEEYCVMLSPLAGDLKELALHNAKDLHQKLAPLAEEIQEKMRTNIEDFNKKVNPYATSVHEIVNQRLASFQKNASPYTRKVSELFYECFENLRMKVTPLAQDIQQRLTDTSKTLTAD
ncbi:apolipoprotein A-I-like [Pristis pectinata]|uniref:apolipoprotein A-I-like n=1 Tax=Pristis pectinata TaxID=685728 RepID=UPI00223D0BA6|nr:apolipoprotein A-I-like [Pristis pectinata]XP_051895944.1 apolipoprotein A-I-like [Pristis pectinata]